MVEGSNDALTLTLDTPKHTGRVRDMRAEVTHKSYFHAPTPYRRSKQMGHQKEVDDLEK